MKKPPSRGAAGELGHVPILFLPLAHLQPSPENDDLYRHITADDPEILSLAASIREHGVQQPLLVTPKRFIVSGHRRFVAAKIAGLGFVPCRVVAYERGDPEFRLMLRECNRQRVKSFDETVREEIVSANPEDAYQRLLAHRAEKLLIGADVIELEGVTRRAAITAAKEPFLAAILRVLEERRRYWPLTDRLIHYALLNDPPLIHASKTASRYGNDHKSYKALCELLTRARLEDRVPFHAIHDPTRPVVTWQCHRGVGLFVAEQMNDFLAGYARDLQQSQPSHVEIVGEKNTVQGIIRPVASDYCIPFTLGRGYSSLTPRHQMAHRFRKSGRGQLVLLVLSDFDPEGEDIPHSFARSMRDDFGVKDVKPIKVALTSDQVREMNLPPQMVAKQDGSRRKKFVDRHGENVFELEAVPPDRLQQILRDAIDAVIDVDAFNAELDAEKQESAYLEGVREAMRKQCFGHVPDIDSGR